MNVIQKTYLQLLKNATKIMNYTLNKGYNTNYDFSEKVMPNLLIKRPKHSKLINIWYMNDAYKKIKMSKLLINMKIDTLRANITLPYKNGYKILKIDGYKILKIFLRELMTFQKVNNFYFTFYYDYNKKVGTCVTNQKYLRRKIELISQNSNLKLNMDYICSNCQCQLLKTNQHIDSTKKNFIMISKMNNNNQNLINLEERITLRKKNDYRRGP